MSAHVLFSDYYKQWIDVFKDGEVKPVTLLKYKQALEWIKKLAPDLYFDEVTRMDFQQLINEYGKTHEKATVEGFLHMVAAPFHDAFHQNEIKTDPTYKIRATSTKKHKVTRAKYLETDDFKKLEAVFKEDGSVRAKMCDFTARTGVRFAECLGITPRDVNKEQMMVDINKSYYYKFKGEWGDTKNPSSVRPIRINDKALQDLGDCMFGLKDNDNVSIFAHALQVEHEQNCKDCKNKNYQKLSPRSLNMETNRWLTAMCKKAGVPRITFHNLRHIHASMLLKDGVPAQAVADRLGHSTVRTTEQTYLHIMKELKHKNDEKIQESINSF